MRRARPSLSWTRWRAAIAPGTRARRNTCSERLCTDADVLIRCSAADACALHTSYGRWRSACARMSVKRRISPSIARLTSTATSTRSCSGRHSGAVIPRRWRHRYDELIKMCAGRYRRLERAVVGRAWVFWQPPEAVDAPSSNLLMRESATADADRPRHAWPSKYFVRSPVAARGGAVAAWFFSPSPGRRRWGRRGRDGGAGVWVVRQKLGCGRYR